jgi:hypothetical protein
VTRVTAEEPNRGGLARERAEETQEPCIEDLFDYEEDAVDFMSAESFPASDPPPAQSERE